MLDEETYLSASKAKELGFIDEIIDAKAEEVESEIFSNKAEQFNNSITTFSSTVEGNEGLLKEINSLKTQMADLQTKLKQSGEEPIEPTQKVAARHKGFFLILKNGGNH